MRGTALSRKFRSQLSFVRVKIPGALRKGGLEGLGEDYRGLLVCYSRYIIERAARSVWLRCWLEIRTTGLRKRR